MTALYWILGILAFFTLLLLCPLTVAVSFEEELRVKLKYLFLSFPLVPAREKPPKKEKRKQRKKLEEENREETGKSGKFRDILKEKGIGGLLRLIKELAKAAAGPLKKLFSHIVLKHFSLDLAVADEDAAQTAILYGQVSAVVYPAVGILVGNTRCGGYHICILPDFSSGKMRARFSARASVRPCFLISAAVLLLFRTVLAFRHAEQPGAGEEAEQQQNTQN